MEVVEEEHERPPRGEALEELADSPVCAIALVVGRRGPADGRRGQRRQQEAELDAIPVAERPDEPWLQACDVLVERVDEDPVRQIALQLSRAPLQHDHLASLGLRCQLGEKPGLSDAGLTDDRDRGGAPVLEDPEGPVERGELIGPSDQAVASCSHAAPPREDRSGRSAA